MRVESFRYLAEGWGVGEVWLEQGALVWHELPQPERPRVSGPPRTTTRSEDIAERRMRQGRDRAGSATVAFAVVERLLAYFAGERVWFDDIELDLDWCTPFQRALAQALRGVRYGETVTYGELAALSGHPNAQRAAGTFCARNRLPVLLPCHRVVAATGVGSYGSLGVGYKRRLLALEIHGGAGNL